MADIDRPWTMPLGDKEAMKTEEKIGKLSQWRRARRRVVA
jgi:hypothetical protein